MAHRVIMQELSVLYHAQNEEKEGKGEKENNVIDLTDDLNDTIEGIKAIEL